MLMKVLFINDSPLRNSRHIGKKLEQLEKILEREESDLVLAPEYYLSSNQEPLTNKQLKLAKSMIADLSWRYKTILIPGTAISMRPKQPSSYRNVASVYELGDPVSGSIKNWVCGSDQTFADSNITGQDIDRVEYQSPRCKEIGSRRAIIEICNDHVKAKELNLPVPSRDLQIVLGCSTELLANQTGKLWLKPNGIYLEANCERVGHTCAKYDGKTLEFLPLELHEDYAVAQITN